MYYTPNPNLSKFASQYGESKGRLYQEAPCELRSNFHRDRDRIIHSNAFRRLEYKTQVFVNHEGDHYRTRLTHTLEVSCVARHISRILRIDEDLTEVIALSHDLGHPPFGHAGETALNKAMQGQGGFDHNVHSLKIITDIERKYPAFNGLNLSWETIEGVVKHNGPFDINNSPKYLFDFNNKFDLKPHLNSSLEAQVAGIADDIAYNNHDIEDGIRAGLFNIKDLMDVEFIKPKLHKILKNYNIIDNDKLIHELKRTLIKIMLTDCINVTFANIEKYKPESVEDIRNIKTPLIYFSEEIQNYHLSIKKFLTEKMYYHPYINNMTNKAYQIIKDLYEFYIKNPHEMPQRWQDEININGKDIHIVISDYIAGMTDRYATDIYNSLIN